MINKIVIHYSDGKIRKGTTENFFPNKSSFNMLDKDTGENLEIAVKDLKAVFFLKSFEGNPNYRDRTDVERVGLGKKIKVHFKDGEVIIGYTQGFSRERAGFILFSADPDSNNDKAFIVTAATDEVNFV